LSNSSDGFVGHYVTEIGSISRVARVITPVFGNLGFLLTCWKFSSSADSDAFKLDRDWLGPAVVWLYIVARQVFGGFRGSLAKTLRWLELWRPKTAVHQLTKQVLSPSLWVV
jgi:hypothetical protein